MQHITHCPSCREPLASPAVLGCGHTYCWACASDLIRSGNVDAPAQCLVCDFPIVNEEGHKLEVHELLEDEALGLILNEVDLNTLSLPPLDASGIKVGDRMLGAGGFGAGMCAE